MRKHFLLLFLMALLPFAGWAANVDISTATVVITLEKTVGDYNDQVQLPQINTVKVGNITYYASQWPQYFTPKYYKKVGDTYVAQNADQIQDAGTYAVRMVSRGATDAENDITYTENVESNEASREDFVINKIDLKISLENGSKQYGANDPNSLEYTLIDLPSGYAVPTLTFANLPITGDHANVSSAGYSYNFKLNDNTQTDITAVNYNIIITNQPKLIVTKKSVTLDYSDNAKQPVKTYGFTAINEDFLTDIATAGKYVLATGQELENGDQLATVLAGINTNKVNYTYKYADNKESANCKDDANLTALTAPAEHKVTITIDESVAGNYKFTVNDVALKVKQAKLTVGDDSKFTFTKAPTTNLTYNGAAQSVNKKLVYNGTTDITVFDETVTPKVGVGEQFEISYKYKETVSSDDEKTIGTGAGQIKDGTAGYYVAYATAVANKNFYTENDAAIAVSAFNFTIDKKPMFVYVTEPAIEKYYKGEDYTLPTSGAITFQNMITADKTTLANAMTAVVAKTVAETPSDKVKDVKVYDIAPVIPANSALETNYTITPLTTTFEVKANPITTTPRDMLNVVYKTQIAGRSAATVDDNTANPPVVGNVDITKTIDAAADIVPADQTTILSAYEVVVAEQTYAAGGEYPEAITLELKSNLTEEVTKLLANFDITTDKGLVTIGPGSYMLVVREKNVTYGEELTWSDFSYFTPSLDAGKAPESVKYMLIDDNTNEEYYEYNNDEVPTNAGTYTIKVDVAHSNIEITNYTTPTEENGNLVSATLTIAPKAITFTLNEVTINQGATKAALKTMGESKVSIVDATDNTKPGLAYEDDVIDFDLVYVADAVGTTQNTNKIALVGGTGTDKDDMKNSTPVDTYAEGYKIVAPAEAAANAANDNYTITWNVTGALKVVAQNTLELNQQADDLMATLDVANGTAYDVTLTGLKFGKEQGVDVVTMNAKKWYSMVLPFEISVAQLSSTLGYAIVNRMDQTTSDGNVHFRLTFDKIPANEPFLVKAVKGVNGDETSAIEINGKTFENVTITKPEDVTVSIKTQDQTPISFTGVYEKQHYPAVGAKGYSGKDNFWEIKTANVSYLDPFRSYWIAPVSARVFVEDLDENGTTVIKEINAQTMNEIAADGWYTVNGIKLQSIPTEKGVYIHNGKKVVLK